MYVKGASPYFQIT